MPLFSSKVTQFNYFQDVLVLIINILLSGCIITPITFASSGLIYIIRDLKDQTAAQFLTMIMISAVLLIVGSIFGIILSEFVCDRGSALGVTLFCNGVTVILLLLALRHVPKIVSICFYIFNLTAGMVGIALIVFLSEQFYRSKSILSVPFMYSICWCHVLGGSYWVYKFHLEQSHYFRLIICFILIVLAFVLIIMIKFCLSKYFIIKTRIVDKTVKPNTTQIILLVLTLISTCLLLVAIMILENNWFNWAKENFTYNRSFEYDIVHQLGYAGVFLIPVILLISINYNSKFCLSLAYLAVMIALFLWPYTSNSCIMDPDPPNATGLINIMIFNPRNCNFQVLMTLDRDYVIDIDTYHFVSLTKSKNYFLKGFQMQLIKLYTDDHCHDLTPLTYTIGASTARPDDTIIYILGNRYIVTGYDNNLVDTINSKATPVARHVSGLPILLILLECHFNCIARLKHLETNFTIEIPAEPAGQVIELLPGKWLFYYSYTLSTGTSEYQKIFEYKPGGYYVQFGIKTLSINKVYTIYIDEPKAILAPYKCDIYSWTFNITYWLLLFGKLMILISLLVITCQSIDATERFIPVAGCFICFFLSYLISTICHYVPINENNYNEMMLALFLILAIHILCLNYLIWNKGEKSSDNRGRQEIPYDSSPQEATVVESKPKFKPHEPEASTSHRKSAAWSRSSIAKLKKK